jgi:hypothetical protein
MGNFYYYKRGWSLRDYYSNYLSTTMIIVKYRNHCTLVNCNEHCWGGRWFGGQDESGKEFQEPADTQDTQEPQEDPQQGQEGEDRRAGEQRGAGGLEELLSLLFIHIHKLIQPISDCTE